MLKANLTISQVLPDDASYPKDGMCKSGHQAGRGVRFFNVAGETLPRQMWGVYCEKCVQAAHKLNQIRKQRLGN